MKKLLASLLVAGLVFTTPLTSLAADNTNLATTEKTITATVRMRVLRAGGESQVTAIGSSLQMADMHVM